MTQLEKKAFRPCVDAIFAVWLVTTSCCNCGVFIYWENGMMWNKKVTNRITYHSELTVIAFLAFVLTKAPLINGIRCQPIENYPSLHTMHSRRNRSSFCLYAVKCHALIPTVPISIIHALHKKLFGKQFVLKIVFFFSNIEQQMVTPILNIYIGKNKNNFILKTVIKYWNRLVSLPGSVNCNLHAIRLLTPTWRGTWQNRQILEKKKHSTEAGDWNRNWKSQSPKRIWGTESLLEPIFINPRKLQNKNKLLFVSVWFISASWNSSKTWIEVDFILIDKSVYFP